MTTRLEHLVKRIGGSALIYIYGSFVDKGREQEQIPFKKMYDITNADELDIFINDIIEKACGDGVEPGADVLGRRPHLEYICSLYKFARLQLNLADELSEHQWDELQQALQDFLDTHDELMNHGKDVVFQNVNYTLTSLKHQTVAGYLPFASKKGNLGSCLTDYVFKFLDKPDAQSFSDQVGKLIQDEKILVAGRQIAKHNKLLEEILSVKPQVKTLTKANLILVEQNKELESDNIKQDLRIDLLEKQLSETQDEISEVKKAVDSLTQVQSTNSSNINDNAGVITTLTQCGFGIFTAPRDITNSITDNSKPTAAPETL